MLRIMLAKNIKFPLSNNPNATNSTREHSDVSYASLDITLSITLAAMLLNLVGDVESSLKYSLLKSSVTKILLLREEGQQKKLSAVHNLGLRKFVHFWSQCSVFTLHTEYTNLTTEHITTTWSYR